MESLWTHKATKPAEHITGTVLDKDILGNRYRGKPRWMDIMRRDMRDYGPDD